MQFRQMRRFNGSLLALYWHDQSTYGVYIRFRYNAVLIKRLKDELPSFSRRWDPDVRAWWFDEQYFDKAREIIGNYETVTARNGEERTRSSRSETTTGGPDSAWMTLFLQPGAPVEVTKAAYRALALLHHPDHGGDVRVMQTINLAYESLMRQLRR